MYFNEEKMIQRFLLQDQNHKSRASNQQIFLDSFYNLTKQLDHKLQMHNSNKGKESKPVSYNSVSISPSETEATIRQKPFSRKPAYAVGSIGSEKKKKIFDESFQVMSLIKLPRDTSNSTIRVSESQRIKQKQKSIHSFSRQPQQKQEDGRRFRDIFYSPKAENSNLLKGFSIFQRKPSKNKTEFSVISQTPQYSLANKSFMTNSKMERDNKAESSFDVKQFKKKWSYKALAAFSPTEPQRPREDKAQNLHTPQKFRFDKSSFIQCAYCSNNKKKGLILQEKLSKLEDQYDQKLQTIRQLTERCNNLTKEKIIQSQKLEKAIETYQQKEEQLLKLKQQWVTRAENLKKDVLKLTETVKYKEIEKSMLLRYKDEYELITKECDRLRYQNDVLKKQITSINSKECKARPARHEGSLFPPTKVQDNKGNFSKKQSADINSNIYYDCEDDSASLVSLNLSEQSIYGQFDNAT